MRSAITGVESKLRLRFYILADPKWVGPAGRTAVACATGTDETPYTFGRGIPKEKRHEPEDHRP